MDEREDVRELQEMRAETDLDEWEKGADAPESGEGMEEPHVPEAPEALVYEGPLSETRIRGVGVVRRGQMFTRAQTCPRIWRRLMGWPGMTAAADNTEQRGE